MPHLLAAAGFSEVEYDVYLALLRLERADAAAVATKLALPVETVAAGIERLAEQGMVRRDHVSEPTFCAVAPDLAVAQLAARQREALSLMQQRADHLAREIAEAHLIAGATMPVEPVVGRTEVLDACVEIQNGAREEVLMIDTAPYFADGAQPNDPEVAALERGVRYRCLYAAASLEAEEHRRHMEHYIGLGEQARVLDGAAPKMLIVDRRVAIVVESSADPDPARRLLVRESSLLNTLVERFELLWDRAGPLRITGESQAEGLSDRDRQLLALLAAGLKDRAAASALGVNERTVGRRINDLMRRLDADSRFQAGVLAVRQGWVD